MAIEVSSGVFRRYTEEDGATGFVLQLSAQGQGFVNRAAPLRARVGEIELENVYVKFSGDGFVGMLATEPAEGDRLFVHYADEAEISTPVTYGPTGEV